MFSYTEGAEGEGERQRESKLPCVFSYKGINPIMRPLPLRPLSPKGSIFKYHHIEIRVSIYEFGQETNIQSIAVNESSDQLPYWKIMILLHQVSLIKPVLRLRAT